MSWRRSIVICVLLGGLFSGCFGCGNQSTARQPGDTPRVTAGVTVGKQPVNFASRSFDPANPPAEMPPLNPGELAECDTNFVADTSVGGQARKTDATHAVVTITQIKVTLQLNVTIWTPTDVTQHVMEHEEGHRQISEYYYQGADELARRIAAKYMGEKAEVTGTDLSAESTKLFQQVAMEIAEEYNKELSPEAAQLRYDSITDHGRNEVVVKDAIAAALKNAPIDSPQAATTPGN